MKFEATKTSGWENAIIGCRLPMCKDYEEAKSKSDSTFYTNGEPLKIGESDMKLLKNLIKADDIEGKTGQPNSKFLRMIHVQVAITAPIFFFKELSTYKIATTYNSTSTMHKLASTPITMDCFEMDDFENVDVNEVPINFIWNIFIGNLEQLRQKYNETKDKRYWKELIRLLPESWLQTRMFDCNYATLRNICSWRSNHKLNEWSGKDKQGVECFINWAKTLPYSEELIFESKSTDNKNKE